MTPSPTSPSLPSLPSSPSSTRRLTPALKWGLIFGLPLGALGAANTLLLLKGAGVGGLPQFIVVLAIFFAAGVLATRATGEVNQGGIAGLIVSTIATALGGLMDVVLAIAAPRAYAYIANLDRLADSPDRLVLTVLFALLGNLILYAMFGGGIGALGGLVGRRLFPAGDGAHRAN